MASVLKTEESKDSVGSNPTASEIKLMNNYNLLLYAVGLARGLLSKYTRPLPTLQDELVIDKIDEIIAKVCYTGSYSTKGKMKWKKTTMKIKKTKSGT